MTHHELRPEVVAVLERRGPENLRILLVASTGPGEQAKVPGLYFGEGSVTGGISRAEVECWLRTKDAERSAKENARAQEQSRVAARALRWTIAGVLVAGVGGIAAIVAAVEGWLALK